MTWSRLLWILCVICGAFPATSATLEVVDLTKIPRSRRRSRMASQSFAPNCRHHSSTLTLASWRKKKRSHANACDRSNWRRGETAITKSMNPTTELPVGGCVDFSI